VAQLAPPEIGKSLECWRVGDAAKKLDREGPAWIKTLSSD
jgi:hypothetical protein